MKILIFSDPHCHAFKPLSETLENGLNSRLQDSLNILAEIKEACKTHNVSIVLCGGDIFHIRSVLNVQTFNEVYDAIYRISVNVQFFGILVGNHDQTNKQGNIHSVYTFDALQNVKVFSNSKWFTLRVDGEQHYIGTIPYYEDKDVIKQNVYNLLETIPSGIGKKILLGHFGISGAKVGANFVMVSENETNLGEFPYKEFDQVFLGHYHLPQKLLENVHYIGATHHHNWGDAGQERGYLIYDTKSNTVSRHPLTSAPNFVPLVYDNFINHKYSEEQIRENFVQMMVPEDIEETEYENIKTDLKKMNPKHLDLIKMERTVHTIDSTASFRPGMDMEALIEEWVRYSAQSNVDSDELIELGKDLVKQADQ